MESENENIEKPNDTTSKNDWRWFLSYEKVVSNIPFYLFLAFLAIVYIYNGHKADKLVRQITTTEKNIRELEYEYKTVKSELIFRSKASELINVVGYMGLKESDKPNIVLSDTVELSIAKLAEKVKDTTAIKDTSK